MKIITTITTANFSRDNNLNDNNDRYNDNNQNDKL